MPLTSKRNRRRRPLPDLVNRKGVRVTAELIDDRVVFVAYASASSSRFGDQRVIERLARELGDVEEPIGRLVLRADEHSAAQIRKAAERRQVRAAKREAAKP